MSNFNSIGLIIALVGVNMFIYHLIDRWFRDRTDVIETGIVRGVRVPNAHLRLLLHTSWLEAVGAQVGFHSIMAIAWMLLGRNADAEEVRLLAYLCSFFALTAVVAWIALAPFWYFRLASVLRESEAG